MTTTSLFRPRGAHFNKMWMFLSESLVRYHDERRTMSHVMKWRGGGEREIPVHHPLTSLEYRT